MEPNIQKYNPQEHDSILAIAAFNGVDTTRAQDTDRYIGYGPTKHGYGPACIVDAAENEHAVEPHVIWFPWVRDRDIISNFKWSLEYFGKTKEVILTTEKAENALFEKFVKNGLLRKVGYIENLPDIEEAHIYQYRRK